MAKGSGGVGAGASVAGGSSSVSAGLLDTLAASASRKGIDRESLSALVDWSGKVFAAANAAGLEDDHKVSDFKDIFRLVKVAQVTHDDLPQAVRNSLGRLGITMDPRRNNIWVHRQERVL